MKLFLYIVLNTVVVIAALYLLIIVVSVSFVASFSSIMKHHTHDLTVILTNKRDNLVKLADLLLLKGVKLDKKKVEDLGAFDLKRIETHDGEDAKQARDELTSYNEYFLAVYDQCNINDEQGECQKVIENIYELEKVYRHHLMMYNADVLGYNFWIAFFPTRFIYKIFRLKSKENIQF